MSDLVHDSSPKAARHGSRGNGSDGRVRLIKEGVASYLPDIDPDETDEWLDVLRRAARERGPPPAPAT